MYFSYLSNFQSGCHLNRSEVLFSLQAVSKLTQLQMDLDKLTSGQYLRVLAVSSGLEEVPLSKLKHLQQQLRIDLDRIEKVRHWWSLLFGGGADWYRQYIHKSITKAVKECHCRHRNKQSEIDILWALKYAFQTILQMQVVLVVFLLM